MTDQKKQKTLSGLCAAGWQTKSALARTLVALQEDGVLHEDVLRSSSGVTSVRHLRRTLHDASASHAAARTPYGSVVQSLQLETDGGSFAWHFLHPAAMLYYICLTIPRFAQFLKSSLASGQGRVVIYADEIRPGNVLRPDKGRAVQCLYWSILEWPLWFRQQAQGWLSLGYLRTKVVNTMKGGMSALIRKLLHVFWPPEGFNLNTVGMRCPCDGDLFYFKLRCEGFMADEKGLKELFNCKGSSGSKPCILCKNLVGRMDLPHDSEYFVKLDAKYSSLDLHDDTTIWESVDALENQAPVLSKSQLHKLEQCLGFNYDTSALLFDKHLRSVLKPASGVLWDSMHCLHHNGVASCHVLHLLVALRSAGVTYKDVDAFLAEFVSPMHQATSGRRALPAKFVQERIGPEVKGQQSQH